MNFDCFFFPPLETYLDFLPNRIAFGLIDGEQHQQTEAVGGPFADSNPTAFLETRTSPSQQKMNQQVLDIKNEIPPLFTILCYGISVS